MDHRAQSAKQFLLRPYAKEATICNSTEVPFKLAMHSLTSSYVGNLTVSNQFQSNSMHFCRFLDVQSVGIPLHEKDSLKNQINLEISKIRS